MTTWLRFARDGQIERHEEEPAGLIKIQWADDGQMAVVGGGTVETILTESPVTVRGPGAGSRPGGDVFDVPVSDLFELIEFVSDPGVRFSAHVVVPESLVADQRDRVDEQGRKPVIAVAERFDFSSL